MAKVAIKPEVLDISLYGDDYTWAVEFHIPDLGDLTEYEITAKFKASRTEHAAVTALTITTTPEGLIDSRFSMGYQDTIPGRYAITLSQGDSVRTYVTGQISVEKGI